MEQEEVSSVSSKSSIQWEPHFRLLGTLGGGIMESQNLELLTCDHWPRSAEGLLGASCVLHHTPAQPAMGQGEDSASGDKWSYRRCVDSLSHRYLVTQISTQHYNLIFPFI